MGDGAYVMALGTLMTKVATKNLLELRLLKISAEKTLKHAEGSTKTSALSREMSNKVDKIKAKLGDNPSSEDYRQNMSECETVETQYTQLIENIRDQMEAIEEKLDLQQNGIQDRLKVVNEEVDQWRQLANQKAEQNCPFKQG